jgi:hypothetical protein
MDYPKTQQVLLHKVYGKQIKMLTLRLRYTGSGYTSGSYSGSIPNPYNEYAKLDLFLIYLHQVNISKCLFTFL